MLYTDMYLSRVVPTVRKLDFFLVFRYIIILADLANFVPPKNLKENVNPNHSRIH